MIEATPAKGLTFTEYTATATLRSLHLIDVENMLGGTSFGEREVAALATAYQAIAGVAATDLLVVSSSHFTARPTWFGWEKARRVVRSGPDGADLALIEIIKTENVAVRFDRVVIASGDQIFAEPAAGLQSAGLAVTVVTRPDFLSRRLRFAVRDVRFIDSTPDPAAAMRRIA